MSTQAELGKKALAAKDFAGAITNYTSALATSQSPLWLMQRANAYQRAGKPELALKDADAALLKARERGRRELMAQAQLRRGLALYALKRYGDARMCYIWTTKLNEKEKVCAISIWGRGRRGGNGGVALRSYNGHWLLCCRASRSILG